MINKIILVGRITKDPEVKHTGSNVAVCNFTIAVNRTFQNQQGERDADFINCVVFRNQAENLARFIKKGGLIGVEGRLQSRSYDAEDGTTRYVTEVVCESIQFLEPKGNEEYKPTTTNKEQYAPKTKQVSSFEAPKKEEDPFFDASPSLMDIQEDDLPF